MGTCDIVTGDCLCDAGWTGQRCDRGRLCLAFFRHHTVVNSPEWLLAWYSFAIYIGFHTHTFHIIPENSVRNMSVSQQKNKIKHVTGKVHLTNEMGNENILIMMYMMIYDIQYNDISFNTKAY